MTTYHRKQVDYLKIGSAVEKILQPIMPMSTSSCIIETFTNYGQQHIYSRPEIIVKIQLVIEE